MKATFGTLYRRPETGMYYIQYTIEGKRQKVSLKTKDKEEAELIFEELANQVQAAHITESVDHIALNVAESMAPGTKGRKYAEELLIEREVRESLDKTKIPLNELYSTFVKERKRPPGKSTMINYKGFCEKFHKFMMEHDPTVRFLEDITMDHADAFEKSIDDLSPSSFNKIMNFFKHSIKVFQHSRKHPALTSNPFVHIQSKRLVTHSKRALSESEIVTLLTTAEGDLKLLFMIGTFTGLRMGDCARLDWTDVSMSQKNITAMPSKTCKYQKTTVIPIHPVLFEELDKIEFELRKGFVLQELGPLYEQGRWRVSDLVAKHFVRCGIKPASLKRRAKKENMNGEIELHSLLDKETVHPFKRRICKIGFHSLRHSFVSLSAEYGGDLVAIQKLTAHSSPQIQQIYLSASHEQALRTINALPSFGLSGDTEKLQVEVIQDSQKNNNILQINGLPPEKVLKLVKLMDENNWEDIKEMILSD